LTNDDHTANVGRNAASIVSIIHVSLLRDAAMPTKKLNIAQAKAQFSKLINDAAHGKTTIVARDGRSVARIAPLDEKPRKIRFGTYKGELVIPADFDAPDPDIIDMFENSAPLFPSPAPKP
jgi:antitoxin (DNA-binding transcriptional repressor) of toxin-antitoxin stability system